MNAEPTPSTEVEVIPAGVSSVRTTIESFQRIVALGVLTLAGSSLLQGVISFRVLLPLVQAEAPVLAGSISAPLLLALAAQSGLIVVLPVVAWLASFVFDEPPLRLALGAGAFVEIVVLALAFFSGTGGYLLGDPAQILARALLFCVAVSLATLAYRGGRLAAERRAARP